MSYLAEKVTKYILPQQVQKMGLYPYFRVIESEQDTVVTMNHKKVLMFGSNSYLGLTNHPKIKEAAKKAIDKYGTGCAGSRFLNGTLDIHLELEHKLAELMGKEAVIVYSTGFQTNLGVIATLPEKDDYLVLDKSDHASIIDGSRLSFSKVFKFNHNDMHSLENKLKICDPEAMKLIVVDGIFSMDGDIAKLPAIVKLAEKYKANVMVDDAHSIGVLGENGSGTASHFGLTNKVDLIMGTFSKSLASIGGFIATDNDTVNFLKHNSRALIFSASLPPASAATVLAAIDIMKSEPERKEHLWDMTRYMIKSLKQLGFDLGSCETPIIPVYIRDDMKALQLTKSLLEAGVFVNPVISPAVSKEESLIRLSLMATHTKEQVNIAIDKIHKVYKQIEELSASKLVK
jgi:8-amino-7-oxononanoate synthase